MIKKAACIPGDIPFKIISYFSNEISKPLCNIINSIFIDSTYPEIWKTEFITPAAKVYPPTSMSEYRPISGMLSFAKVTDKIISSYIITDMTKDKRQYGNEKGVSVNHYLIKMLHKILSSVDKNSAIEENAVILSMIDASQAFERQSHNLGIQSFLDNNVRVALMPTLISFFKNRKLTVKWNQIFSKALLVTGGGG